ncbi:MAG: SCO family protein [Pseudomonadota bacterium]
MIRLALAALLAATPALADAPAPLPFALGGAYELTDHTGATRTQADPDGNPQLLFFGYANCQEICSAALPLMGNVADTLADEGVAISLVMITVDPEFDTVEAIGPALHQIHPDFVGLTGAEADLQVAYDAFNIESELLFHDPAGRPVYSHGSMLYLLDGQGEVMTLVPPVLSPTHVADIVRGYVAPAG